MYTRVPGFAAASEWAYTFFARRRDLLSRATHLLWGPVLEPERNTLVSWLFLRLFGAIYIPAFASLGVQFLGWGRRGSYLSGSISPPRGRDGGRLRIGGCPPCSGSTPAIP